MSQAVEIPGVEKLAAVVVQPDDVVLLVTKPGVHVTAEQIGEWKRFIPDVLRGRVLFVDGDGLEVRVVPASEAP